MKKIQISNFLPIAFALFLGTAIYAQDEIATLETVEVMGDISEEQEVVQTDIITFLSSSEEYSTLVSALKATGLAEKLSGEGPYTIFAPTNEAFNKLGEEKITNLLKPENKEKLTSILEYHIIAGKADAQSVLAAIEDGQGKADFKTVGGQPLTASVKEETVYLTDANGNAVSVIDVDILQTNGVVHSIDAVIMPLISEKSYE